MVLPHTATYNKKMRGLAYVLNFIFSFQLATVGYFTANFLDSLGFSIEQISIILSLSAIFAFFSFLVTSYIFKALGLRRSAMIYSFLYLISFLFVALGGKTLSVWALILSAIPSAAIVVLLDTLMEKSNTSEKHTGVQRALFLMMANTAFVAGPFLGGQLVKGGDFSALYLGSVALFLPFLLLVFLKRRLFPADRNFRVLRFKHLFKIFKAQDDIKKIFFAQFVLYFFYSVMVLYTSVYLVEHLGFSLEQVGFILPIMLLPFIVLTVPVGFLADKIGEKEMMVLGFLIMATTTVLFGSLDYLSFVSFVLVASVLVFTRVGAAFVSTVTESYFFKHVDGTDTETITAFRALYPLANITGSLFGVLIFSFASFGFLFSALGVFVLLGALVAFKLRDTN